MKSNYEIEFWLAAFEDYARRAASLHKSALYYMEMRSKPDAVEFQNEARFMYCLARNARREFEAAKIRNA